MLVVQVARGDKSPVSVSDHLEAAASQVRLRGKDHGATAPFDLKMPVRGNADATLLGVVSAQTSMPWSGYVDNGVVHLLWKFAAAPRVVETGYDHPTSSDAAQAARLRMDHRPKPQRAAGSGRAFYH